VPTTSAAAAAAAAAAASEKTTGASIAVAPRRASTRASRAAGAGVAPAGAGSVGVGRRGAEDEVEEGAAELVGDDDQPVQRPHRPACALEKHAKIMGGGGKRKMERGRDGDGEARVKTQEAGIKKGLSRARADVERGLEF